jgi:hypothetical protein
MTNTFLSKFHIIPSLLTFVNDLFYIIRTDTQVIKNKIQITDKPSAISVSVHTKKRAVDIDSSFTIIRMVRTFLGEVGCNKLLKSG